MRSMRIGGRGPYPSANSDTSSAPVGVRSSPAGPSPAYTGAPAINTAVAGAGTGIVPWAQATVPLPTLTAEATMRSAPNHSSAKTPPTMSMMESSAPTSCRCTFSTGIRCIAASVSASLRNSRAARARDASASADRSTSFRMPGRWRCGWPSPPRGTSVTVNFVAPTPDRVTGSAETAHSSPRARLPRASRRRSKGRPASSRAPMTMSPDAPEKQSRYRIRAIRQIRPISLKLQYLASARIRWSTTSMPISSPASTRRAVNATSSPLGVGSPDG